MYWNWTIKLLTYWHEMWLKQTINLLKVNLKLWRFYPIPNYTNIQVTVMLLVEIILVENVYIFTFNGAKRCRWMGNYFNIQMTLRNT